MARRSKTTSVLTAFDGKPVLGASVAITGAGDGLSAALAVDPQEWHHEEILHVVLECRVSKIRMDPIKDTDGLLRVHFLKAGTATIVDGALVADVLNEQVRRLEEAAGVSRLGLGDELARQHEAGDHAEGLVDGCPACDTERDLVAAGE